MQKRGHFETTSAYGTHLNIQNEILDSMHVTVAAMRIIRKKTLLPFQKGFLMSITAVKGLFASLQALYNAQYILTARLNQDCLENFFSQLRGIGHHYDHPTPAEVKHRFRLLLVARNCVDLNNSNVWRDAETDDNGLLPDDSQFDEYLTVHLLNNAHVFLTDADKAQDGSLEDSLTELSADDIDKFLEETVTEEAVTQSGAMCQTVASSQTEQVQSSTGDHLSADALHYLSGYVAFKLKRQHPDLGQVSSQISSAPITCRMWLPCLSHGGLRIPSDDWFRVVQQLEIDFRAKNVIASLVKMLASKFPTAPESAISCFIRTCTFIRMR